MDNVAGINVAETFHRPAAEPLTVTALSAQHLSAASRRLPGDDAPVLVIGDGEIEFEISHEIGLARVAAKHLRAAAAAMLAHAELIESQANQHRGWS